MALMKEGRQDEVGKEEKMGKNYGKERQGRGERKREWRDGRKEENIQE